MEREEELDVKERRTTKLEVRSIRLKVGELIVQEGNKADRGKNFRLSEREFVIGTSPSCDIRLHDETVSRFHCKILWDEKKQLFCVKDLGSTNGTFINGVEVKEALIPQDGAMITLGKTKLFFRYIGRERNISLFPSDRFYGCVGRSIAMREIFSTAMKIAQSDLNILIEGETGVGKEELARAIHMASPRKSADFVVCDLSTIPPELFPSELFGYEKGAFTSAEKSKEGLLEIADGGTIFLDEIGEVSPQNQVHLLRFTERKEVRRIGSSKTKKVDVRIISATSKNIDEEIERGKFRADLFYRLAQFRIKIPPLRERKEDIFPLIENFLDKLSPTQKEKDIIMDFFKEHSSLILGYEWRGNVRELRNFVERTFHIYRATGELRIDITPDAGVGQYEKAKNPAIFPSGISYPTTNPDESSHYTASHFSIPTLLPDDIKKIMIDKDGKIKSFKDIKRSLVEGFESVYVRELYRLCKGNISECARVAGVNRKYMEKLVKKYIKGQKEEVEEKESEEKGGEEDKEEEEE